MAQLISECKAKFRLTFPSGVLYSFHARVLLYQKSFTVVGAGVVVFESQHSGRGDCEWCFCGYCDGGVCWGCGAGKEGFEGVLWNGYFGDGGDIGEIAGLMILGIILLGWGSWGFLLYLWGG